MRILIANRGEIARRIIRTAHGLGHQTVAVYADPDAAAPHVSEATFAHHIGPAALGQSYLSIERLMAAAIDAGADAVHPGYGFLSENAVFAQAVMDADLTWVGPNPNAIGQMGSKINARRLAQDAGVPVIPGYDESQRDEDLAAAAERIGYPILVKAAAGGGGKGIRIAAGADAFAAALAEARAEGERSFGNSDMIVERFIERPRHVEVQIVGDKHGQVIELGTRECSVQRRYQKVLEEAPAPNLPDATRFGLRDAAAKLAHSIGYDSTGTVEFIVDDADTDLFYFLEMNTRLQVEHPVTEFVTGLDLVELQLRVAAGEPLPLGQDDVVLHGHAFEARINAEDATRNFAPQIGTVTDLIVPPGVRWDSAIESGSEISPYYDPMIAKLIVGGSDREVARRRLAAALDQLLIGGLVTNTGFQRWLIDQPEIVEGRVTTRFLDDTPVPSSPDMVTVAEIAAEAWAQARAVSGGFGVWHALGSFRTTPHRSTTTVPLVDVDGQTHEISVSSTGCDVAHAVDLKERRVVVNVEGQSHTFDVLTRSDHWAPDDAVGHGSAHAIVAPFPAVVAEVRVGHGDKVVAGDSVVVIEAMKMLHTLAAAGPGVVDEIRVDVGRQVATDQILVTFVTPDVGEQP